MLIPTFISELEKRMKLALTNVSKSELTANHTLKEFLEITLPEYTQVVPSHWLDSNEPQHSVQLLTAIVLLLICLTGNINQILVFIAYGR